MLPSPARGRGTGKDGRRHHKVSRQGARHACPLSHRLSRTERNKKAKPLLPPQAALFPRKETIWVPSPEPRSWCMR
ncbi:hypothetical protein CBM2586_B90329 [Cupriavidus phytorum]|uniref:Uncharacterized protein n=1 Tax=Cupriavidus taiwanensis TaxID=164546 RepID=A0A976ACE6_9BURK|nr:hypothetical protein CBM2586_B90329 [Cupriavidus taiwanensis]